MSAALLLCHTLPASAGVGNFCPPGETCDITHPVFINVYWDDSQAQWDRDVTNAGQGDMRSGRIDALLGASIHSNYFAGLAGYSVASAAALPSIASTCVPVPATIDQAHDEMADFAACVLAAHPTLDPSTTILNVLLPPQVVPASRTSDYCAKFDGDHDTYGSPIEMTRIPANPACNSNIAELFETLTHEMVEAATDPTPASPTGWKVFGGGSCDEIADLCRCTGHFPVPPPFLFALLSPYWVDGMNDCFRPSLLSVPPDVAPSVRVSGVGGGGRSLTITLTGASTAGSVQGPPWDLAPGGGKTLYLKATVSHPGQALWGAGDIEGTPPDRVEFGSIDWSDDGSSVQIRTNGFADNYGTTIDESFDIDPVNETGLIRQGNIVTVTTTTPNSLTVGAPFQVSGAVPSDFDGAFVVRSVASSTTFTYQQVGANENGGGGTANTSADAIVAPGDAVTVTYTDPLTGLSKTTSGTAPFPASIAAQLDETRPQHPTVQEFERFSGTVTDASGGGMEGVSVSCGGCSAPPVTTAISGLFVLPDVLPGAIAGPQSVTLQTGGAGGTLVTSTLTPLVYPVVTSLDSAIGPVSGGVPVEMHGAGYDQQNTRVTFRSPFFGLPTNVAPLSVSANHQSLQFLSPTSPLPGDGSGIAFVSATVNGATSSTIQYLFIVPGKPVLNVVPAACGGGTAVPNVYGPTGAPTQVAVTMTAPYAAFRQSDGTFADQMAVTSGQSVPFVGEGPLTAINAKTGQRATVALSLPRVNPCSVGTLLLPRIRGAVFWNPSLMPDHIGPRCGDCPTDFSDNVIWTQGADPITAGGFVSITGRSVREIRDNFEVRSLGSQEVESNLIAGHTLTVVRGIGSTTEARTASSLGYLQFVGPAISISLRHHFCRRSRQSGETFLVNFRLPQNATNAKQYRIVHLATIDGVPSWQEDVGTAVSGHDGAVSITTREIGIYALTQVP